ncbi:hypothetical protein [Ferruginibacter sp.]
MSISRNKISAYLALCFIPALSPAQTITGKLSAPLLNEISGAAFSQLNKNILYVHNDSGDSSRFFSINTAGELLTTHVFTARPNSKLGVLDCEDIAVGPGPVKGESYIYLADIGDNFHFRPSVQVYRFKEPATMQSRDTLKPTVLNLTYPKGPRDAETIMIDPKEKMIYIISKREDTVGIYRCPLNFNNNSNIVLQDCGKIFFEGKGKEKWIVAGDISSDGNSVLIKSVSKVYYWQRNGNEPLYKTLQRTPAIQSRFTSHGQEESIAFAPDGKGYYVMAEGKGTGIYYYTIEK